MSTKPDIFEILAKGYFPKELPPCFSTYSFAKAVKDYPEFLEKLEEQTKQHKHSYAVPFSVPKWSGFRRSMGIPHPLFYTSLAQEISDKWLSIKRVQNKSKLSKSKVRLGEAKEERYMVPEFKKSDLSKPKAIYATTAKYVLNADSSNYYQSIYTHTIPWCIHGKRTSRNRISDPSLLGNIIDKKLRKLQHDESFGMPIGPDISLALSEIIGSTIDRMLCKKLRDKKISFRGIRYVDDYNLYFSKEDDARYALSCLRDCFAELKLSLNESKTSINQLPEPVEQPWNFEIKKFQFDSKFQITDIKHFFALTFSAQEKHPNEAVVSYALKCLIPNKRIADTFQTKRLKVKEEYWEDFLTFVCQAITSKPESMRFGYLLLNAYYYESPSSKQRDWNILEESINHLIAHSDSNDDYELCWALWFVRSFKLMIRKPAANIISLSKNPIVILLALDLQETKRLPQNTFNTDFWKTLLNSKNPLNSSLWLLYYECAIRKWLGLNRNSLKSHYWMNKLSEKRVEFFQSSLAPRARRKVNTDSKKDDFENYKADWYDWSISIPTSY